MSFAAGSNWDAICRRAGGRRHYNRVRQFRAVLRLTQIVALLKEIGLGRGYQTRIAERLGVSRGTICRDIARLNRIHWGGRKADEEHRSTARLERRIRAENRAELDRTIPDAAESEAVEDVQPPSPPPDHLPPPAQPPQLPKRLPSIRSDLGSSLAAPGARSRDRRGE